MRIHLTESTDAFIAFDLDGAETSAGVTRLAPKVLRDGAELLSRSTTYTFAAFGLRLGGASAGINAAGDAREAAVAAFVEEVAPLVADRRWLTWPGLGLSEDDLAPLDPLPTEAGLLASGAVAAADAFTDSGIEGRRAVVAGDSAPLDQLGAVFADRGGASLEPGAVDADCDVLFVAGKAGVVDHSAAAGVTAKVLVPLSPVPVTAKAYAVLSRAGVVYLPDFVTAAAPLLAALDPDGGDPVERVGALASELSGAGCGAWMAAVERAEASLSGWQERLPFGRPLA